jgi:hypothetical protein
VWVGVPGLRGDNSLTAPIFLKGGLAKTEGRKEIEDQAKTEEVGRIEDQARSKRVEGIEGQVKSEGM